MNIKSVIRDILINKPETRNSDHWLYFEYIKAVMNKADKYDFINIFLEPKKNNIANFETVSRARRKIQEEDRESGDMLMQAEKNVEKERREKEKEFRQLYSANYKFAESRWTEEKK